MPTQAHLRKLRHSLDEKNNVQYRFALDQESSEEDIEIPLNDFLGKKISFKYLDRINCVSCGRKTNKSFNQGYCYPCLNTKAECDICIIKPELCHFDQGTCRDNEFAETYCNIKHTIYLSLTSALKIGITRQNQERSRWIDQGAVQALRLTTTAKRYHAGLIEKELAKNMADKTNWRKMLKNEYPDLNIAEEKSNVLEELVELLEENNSGEDFDYIYDAISDDQKEKVVNINYPVLEYPEKVKSFNMDKDPLVEGTLQGIKGQYLILDTGVINMRKYAGYLVECDFA